MPTERPWEAEARDWVAWVRTPGHDIFPYYAPTFFDEIVPPARGLTLEIGCGEGRVTRELTSRAHNVVALDSSSTLLEFARAADARSAYVSAHGPSLPFADGIFDTILAYNSLQTMAKLTDMAQTVAEAARVLKPSGHLCICVGHPATDVVCVGEASANRDQAAPLSYFDHQLVNDTVNKNGLSMTFHGWTYTLEDYVRALEDAGFLIEKMREPLPTEDATTPRRDLDRWRRAPLFLFIRAVKSAR